MNLDEMERRAREEVPHYMDDDGLRYDAKEDMLALIGALREAREIVLCIDLTHASNRYMKQVEAWLGRFKDDS